MTYYVIYQEYQEYNQFEGTWNTDYHSFDSLELANKFAVSCANNSDLRFIAGPLIKVEDIKNF